MSLTKTEQRFFKLVRNYETNPPTLLKLFFGCLPIGVLLPIGLVIIAFLSYHNGQRLTSMLCLGALCGIWMTFFRSVIASLRVWTILIRVINWQKYDELMEEETANRN